MNPAATDLDETLVRRLLRVGGLDVDHERVRALLPVASALLVSCGRLAALDLAVGGGCGPDDAGSS